MNIACGSALIGAAMVSLALTGCEFDHTVTGPLRTQTISLDINKAQQANVKLEMAAGELEVRGGTPKLLDGRVEYNVPHWQPEVVDNNDGQVADVTIRQPEHGHVGGNTKYRWDLQLNDTIPLDLEFNCGAGQGKLELGDLNLRNVNVHMGAGQVDLDLDGHPAHSYTVNVAGGVGQATIRLPRNVGVRAEAHGGLGSIEVRGLTKRDDYYSNDLLNSAKVNVFIKVEGGIGEIRILG
jgi:hypothetical protein